MTSRLRDQPKRNADGQLVIHGMEADTSFADVIIGSTYIRDSDYRKRLQEMKPLYAKPTMEMWEAVPHELVFADAEEHARLVGRQMSNNPYIPTFTCLNGISEYDHYFFVGVCKGSGRLNGRSEQCYATQTGGNITIFHTGQTPIQAGKTVYARRPSTTRRDGVDLGSVSIQGIPRGKVYFETEPLSVPNIWSQFLDLSVKFRGLVDPLRVPALGKNDLLHKLSELASANSMARHGEFCPMHAFAKALLVEHVLTDKKTVADLDENEAQRMKRELFNKKEMKKASDGFETAWEDLSAEGDADFDDLVSNSLDGTHMSMMEIGAALLAMQIAMFDSVVLGKALNSVQPGGWINLLIRPSSSL